MPRPTLLNEIANRIGSIERAHPVRVGIDGPGAAGKTILADELADVLRSRGRHVIRAGVDGFHNPPDVRYRRGRDCVHGYYHDSFDYAAMCEQLLDPLGPTGARRYRPAVYDFRVESPVDRESEQAPDDSVLLFEGVFIQRPELAEHWDLTVYVHAEFEETRRRAMTREHERFGSPEAVERKYNARYIPGQRMYIDACEPRERATMVVDNNDPVRPALIRRPRVWSDRLLDADEGDVMLDSNPQAHLRRCPVRTMSWIQLGAVAAIAVPFAFASVGCSNGQKVYSVDSVSVSRSGPPTYDVTLTATGQTRTDGWTDLRLSPRGFNDVTGEYLFELRGDSPEGVGASVMTPMSATFKIIGGPMNLKSIKVRAETNTITQTTFSTAPAEAVEAPTPAVSHEPAVTDEPAPGVVGPKPQFEAKEKSAPKPEPAPETPDDLEDALEK